MFTLCDFVKFYWDFPYMSSIWLWSFMLTLYINFSFLSVISLRYLCKLSIMNESKSCFSNGFVISALCKVLIASITLSVFFTFSLKAICVSFLPFARSSFFFSYPVYASWFWSLSAFVSVTFSRVSVELVFYYVVESDLFGADSGCLSWYSPVLSKVYFSSIFISSSWFPLDYCFVALRSVLV